MFTVAFPVLKSQTVNKHGRSETSKSVVRRKRRRAVFCSLGIEIARMVYFPVRKCYQAAKVAVLVVLVVTILALFEQWRGGKKNTRAEYSDPIEAEYESQILDDEARIIPGLGEGGAAAHLIGDEKKLGEESEKKLAINVYLSDRIPYNRTLKGNILSCTNLINAK